MATTYSLLFALLDGTSIKFMIIVTKFGSGSSEFTRIICHPNGMRKVDKRGCTWEAVQYGIQDTGLYGHGMALLSSKSEDLHLAFRVGVWNTMAPILTQCFNTMGVLAARPLLLLSV